MEHCEPRPITREALEDLVRSVHFCCIAGNSRSGKTTLAQDVLRMMKSHEPASTEYIVSPENKFSGKWTQAGVKEELDQEDLTAVLARQPTMLVLDCVFGPHMIRAREQAVSKATNEVLRRAVKDGMRTIVTLPYSIQVMETQVSACLDLLFVHSSCPLSDIYKRFASGISQEAWTAVWNAAFPGGPEDLHKFLVISQDLSTCATYKVPC